MRNKILVALSLIVLSIFIALGITMVNDSQEDLVGEIEEVELFMLEITEVEFYEGEADKCVLISAPIVFSDMGIMFDYVREICYYDGYLVFESQGRMFITNGTYTIMGGMMIDDIAGLGERR